MPMHVSMVDPRGRECFAGSAEEVHNLIAQGYKLGKGKNEGAWTAPEDVREEDDAE